MFSEHNRIKQESSSKVFLIFNDLFLNNWIILVWLEIKCISK